LIGSRVSDARGSSGAIRGSTVAATCDTVRTGSEYATDARRALFGLIGAIIGVPIAAGLQIAAEELTAARRARIAAQDAAKTSPA
jgi:hypothetical protein